MAAFFPSWGRITQSPGRTAKERGNVAINRLRPIFYMEFHKNDLL